MLLNRYRIVAGSLIWTVLTFTAAYFLFLRPNPSNEKAWQQLANYSAGPSQYVDLHSEQPLFVGITDQIFLLEPDGSYRRIGEIKSIDIVEPVYNLDNEPLKTIGRTHDVVAMFYHDAPRVTDDCVIRMHETPASLEWVVNEMAKDGAWDEYQTELIEAFKTHSGEIFAEFRPVLEAGLKDAVKVIGEDLQAAVAKRRDRIEKIAARYEDELFQEQVVPLIQNEIIPIIREQAEPTLNEVGNEIWLRASLWRFGWRLAYDKMPLPKRDLTAHEWNRFVEDEVIPVLESHLEEFIEVQKNILADIVKNEKVRALLRDSVNKIANDKEIRAIVQEIASEVFVTNERLRKVVKEHWESPAAQEALSLAADRFESTIVNISEKMFGTPETQITPSFARVLRNQVLRKDIRWFTVTYPQQQSETANPASQLKFEFVRTGNENPFVQLHEMHPPRKK